VRRSGIPDAEPGGVVERRNNTGEGDLVRHDPEDAAGDRHDDGEKDDDEEEEDEDDEEAR